MTGGISSEENSKAGRWDDKEIEKLKHEINVIEKDIESIKSDLSKETDKLKLFESRSGNAKEKLKEMTTKYPWIDTER